MRKKKRRCRSFELTGRRIRGCKKYIDNGNHLFCSVCHRELRESSPPEPAGIHSREKMTATGLTDS